MRQWPTHGNQPPRADAGIDQSLVAERDGLTSVVLDGSATTDADGEELTYWWNLNGEFFADGVQPLVELPMGRHLIQLVVRDPADNISTDETIVEIRATFLRGDSNTDGTVDISDAINTLGFLFTGSGVVTCRDAADANDDGVVDISDAIATLGFLFLGTPPTLLAPYPDYGPDPTADALGCEDD